MNPFDIEGIDVSLNTWRWLYIRQDQEIKVPKDEVGLAHLNTLVRHGLLVYSRGCFLLTDISREVLLKAELYERELQIGVPLTHKTTTVDVKSVLMDGWTTGKTREKRTFFTNNEIIVFSLRLRDITPIIDEMSLEMEVLVSQIRKAIFAEGYIDVYPRILQRASFFEPGVIWFKGGVGDPVAIKESYYDLVTTTMCSRLTVPSTYAKISFETDYVVVRNPHRPSRYYEDIIAIIRSHTLEGFDECMI